MTPLSVRNTACENSRVAAHKAAHLAAHLAAHVTAPATGRRVAAWCLAASSLLLGPPGQAQTDGVSPQQTLPLALSYTPANTNPLSTSFLGVSVSADGKRLTVKSTPVQGAAGGRLNFGGYPWWITVADFAPYGGGPGQAFNGDRYRGSGELTPPAGVLYTAARLKPGTLNVYELTPVAMSGITRGYVGGWTGTLTGTITTDGHRGRLQPANVVDFDLHVDGVETRN